MNGAPRVAYVLRTFPKLSETFILGEILALRRLGVDVRVFALERGREPRVHPAARRLLAGVTFVPARLDGRAGDARAARRAHEAAGAWIGARLARLGVTHVHAHFAGPAAVAAAAAARRAGATYSFTAHAKDIFSRKVDWAWLRRAARGARAVVTVCAYNRRWLARRLPGARIEMIRNGVDLDRWRPAAGPRDRGHVVAVGRLVPKKGFDLLVGAIARLAARGVRARLTVVGEGAERERLERLAREAGVARRVRFAGGLTEPRVRALVRRATVVALACRRTADGNQDALPTALLEAGACGVPCVSTRVAGVPEIIRDGRTGFVVAPDDEAALTRALGAVLSDAGLRARLGAAARERIERRFDRRRAAAALAGLFLEPRRGVETREDARAHRAAVC